MVRYLKLIVLIFGTIGLIAASFFYLQNKRDIAVAWDYSDKIDYNYLLSQCPEKYVYPRLKTEFSDYLTKVSLTGTSIGLKMVFTVMDEDKANVDRFPNDKYRDFQYSIHYLELNNLALNNPFKRYHGFKPLYGGYIATLTRFYEKAYHFSDNIIIGLEGHEGIKSLQNAQQQKRLTQQLESIKTDYYQIKQDVEIFLDSELKRLDAVQD